MTLEGEHLEAGIDRTEEIAKALESFGYRLIGSPEPIAESVLNENYRVETEAGSRFLRMVRSSRTVERLFPEQRMLDWVAARGIPIVRPELGGDGMPFVRPGADLIQVLPWVEGRHGALSPGDAALLGETEARVHVALADFADADLPRGGAGVSWDTDRSIQVLRRVDDVIRYYPSPPAESLRVQEALRFQLELLESDVVRPVMDFAGLATQPCHGDYHSRNVLIGPAGAVAAVVDWEVARVIPPVFELLRALSYSHYLESPPLEAYLRGYGSVRRFSADECVLGVEMWWQSRIHGVWPYEMRFIRGDRRPARFFEDEDTILRRFCDRDYRSWLVSELQSHTGA